MNDRMKISKCVTTLKFKLTDKEKLEKGNLLATLSRQIAVVDGVLKQAKSRHKADSAELKNQFEAAVSCLSTGTEHREVECEEVRDYEAKRVSYLYEGEVMEERPMRQDEMQLRIA